MATPLSFTVEGQPVPVGPQQQYGNFSDAGEQGDALGRNLAKVRRRVKQDKQAMQQAKSATKADAGGDKNVGAAQRTSVYADAVNLVSPVLAYGAMLFHFIGPRSNKTPASLWWMALTAVCTVQVAVAGICIRGQQSQRLTACLLVCLCYWHRATFMHCTVERHCFFDLPNCSPLLGRTVACIGELTFVRQASKILVPRWSNVVVGLIAVAQTLSFIGVMKRNYGWFFFENSIWTVVAFVMMVARIGATRHRLVPLFLGLFFLYNVTEDLPMYYRRHKSTMHVDGYDLGLVEGAWDSVFCGIVSSGDEIWQPQMLWMTLNYTLVPWASIYLAWREMQWRR